MEMIRFSFRGERVVNDYENPKGSMQNFTLGKKEVNPRTRDNLFCLCGTQFHVRV